MRLAALMLARGDEVGEVAAATEVPVALVELLAADYAVDDVQDAADVDRQLRGFRARTVRGRRMVIAAIVVDCVAVINAIVCVLALLGGNPRLAGLCGVAAVALLVAVFALARWQSRTAYPVAGDPRQVSRRDPGGGESRER